MFLYTNYQQQQQQQQQAIRQYLPAHCKYCFTKITIIDRFFFFKLNFYFFKNNLKFFTTSIYNGYNINVHLDFIYNIRKCFRK